jgi:hypothetical protein
MFHAEIDGNDETPDKRRRDDDVSSGHDGVQR